MKIGDVTTEEPTRIGTIVRDRDGDLYELTGKGWTGDWMWSSIQESYGPLTVAHLPESAKDDQSRGDEEEWEEVLPEDLRVGDEVEVTRRGRVAEVSPSRTAPPLIVLVGGAPYDFRNHTFRRRIVRDMPEPEAPALVVHAGRAFVRPNASNARFQWRDVTGENGEWFAWKWVLDLDRTTPPRIVPWDKIIGKG